MSPCPVAAGEREKRHSVVWSLLPTSTHQQNGGLCSLQLPLQNWSAPPPPILWPTLQSSRAGCLKTEASVDARICQEQHSGLTAPYPNLSSVMLASLLHIPPAIFSLPAGCTPPDCKISYEVLLPKFHKEDCSLGLGFRKVFSDMGDGLAFHEGVTETAND